MANFFNWLDAWWLAHWWIDVIIVSLGAIWFFICVIQNIRRCGMDKTEVGCFLDDWGNQIGALLVVAPMVWDVFGLGFRGFWEWNIGTVGIISQLLGVGIVLLTRHARRNW